MSNDREDTKTTTLTDADIETKPEEGRRSVLAIVGATVLGAASKALGGCIVAQPQPQVVQAQPVQGGQTVVVQQGQTGITDNDQGTYADPVSNGRGGMRGMVTGITDGDSGTISDPVNQGRGHWGRGGATGLTDSDAGSYSDPVSNGRGTSRLGYTGLTDGDGGQWADAVGHGRGRPNR